MRKEFSLHTTPNVSIKFAVLASSCVPFLFTPIKDLSGNIYVDGGLLANSPFHYLTDTERKETLALAFNLKDHFAADPNILSSFFNYFQRMYVTTYFHQDNALYEKWGHNIMYLETNKINPFHLKATSEEKRELYDLGRKSAHAFLHSKSYPKILRRNSLP